MSDNETYTLAHTVQCKLRMAADKPDRNLRFILGHTITFDKIMCRIVEMENERASIPSHDDPVSTGRRVSFKDNNARPTDLLRQEVEPPTKKGAQGARAPSPPPDPNVAHMGDEDDEGDHPFEEDEDADDPSLSLSRTISASARPPPNLVPSDGDSSDEDDEPTSPPWVPSNAVLETIIEEEGDEMLAGLYEGIRKCRCQNDVDQRAPPIAKAWEVPQPVLKKAGKGVKQIRMAVVQIQT
jgi:hypothetical protein